ncbi:hypothetical protein nbrc107696_28140 [Gordonia spumicola]|uniref:Lipoprotein n=1 Tax=Gordonia spumicola TaxID=589161 RepID=A0A7I9VAG5_9ACTN|nr:hypothetical protein nbrc107696_28140 [Gordonia spumicola]
MKRTLGAVLAVVAAGAVLAGCGSSDSSSNDGVSTDAKATVKVEGKDLSGLDLSSVNCVKAGDKITVGSAAIDGQQGIGIIMTDGNPPKVDSSAWSSTARHSRSLPAPDRPRCPSTATPTRSRAPPRVRI